MTFDNQMTLIVDAKSENEGFVRSTVAAFCVRLNPTINEINDIKTAVSEAVTNCIVHAYQGKQKGRITIVTGTTDKDVFITIIDSGVGIKDISLARQPFFTSKPEQERSGMGFTVMESFMDSVKVENNAEGSGTIVLLRKRINGK